VLMILKVGQLFFPGTADTGPASSSGYQSPRGYGSCGAFVIYQSPDQKCNFLLTAAEICEIIRALLFDDIVFFLWLVRLVTG